MCERGEKEIQNKNDMKKYQLYRPLLYQDRRSIDEFIKEDPMWEELYRLYLQMRRQYSKKINSLKTFNTVRFFCTCVMTDPHPEDDIKENYLQPLRGISDIDADICCTIDLWPHPTNISSLPSDKKWWNDASCGFTADDLYCMLNFWPNNADKLKVLERMRQAGMPEHQYVEIRSEIMTLDEEGETAEFQENFLLLSGNTYNVWQDYRRAQNAYIQLQMPEMALQAAQDGEKEEHI